MNERPDAVKQPAYGARYSPLRSRPVRIRVNFYNDNDPRNAAWLRELVAAGHLPPGDVDARSIKEIRAHELARYTQCHFFAGIGGWSLALQLAGWPAWLPVWTGSCPCQPFSAAGKGMGTADPRHLWPDFRELVRESRPPVVFGEQVASKAGRGWLAGVFADLEAMAYRRAGADLCAAGVGAPHIRQRLFWVADLRERVGGLADPEPAERGEDHRARGIQGRDGLRERQEGAGRAGGGRGAGGLAHPCGEGSSQLRGWRKESPRPSETGRPWDEFDLVPCRDGKARRVEPGTFPLADGVPERVGRLRGYGNAIVPQLAAEFIRAYREAAGMTRGSQDLQVVF